MAKKFVSPRKRKIDNIVTKIAMFIMQDTFTDEPIIQNRLNDVARLLDVIGVELEAADKVRAEMKDHG